MAFLPFLVPFLTAFQPLLKCFLVPFHKFLTCFTAPLYILPNHFVTPLNIFLADLTIPLTNLRNFLLCLYSSINPTTTAAIAEASKINGFAFKKLNAALKPLPVAFAAPTKPFIANLAPLVAT